MEYGGVPPVQVIVALPSFCPMQEIPVVVTEQVIGWRTTMSKQALGIGEEQYWSLISRKQISAAFEIGILISEGLLV